MQRQRFVSLSYLLIMGWFFYVVLWAKVKSRGLWNTKNLFVLCRPLSTKPHNPSVCNSKCFLI